MAARSRAITAVRARRLVADDIRASYPSPDGDELTDAEAISIAVDTAAVDDIYGDDELAVAWRAVLTAARER